MHRDEQDVPTAGPARRPEQSSLLQTEWSLGPVVSQLVEYQATLAVFAVAWRTAAGPHQRGAARHWQWPPLRNDSSRHRVQRQDGGGQLGR
jgi:hypothetical protein